MNHASLAHASVEIPVRRGRTDFSFRKDTIAHAKACTAGGVRHTETGIHENVNQAFFKSCLVHLRRCRGYYAAYSVSDMMPLQNCRRDAQV